jgi:hypothetical protein
MGTNTMRRLLAFALSLWMASPALAETAASIPPKFNIPWGNSASAPDIRTIPQASQIGVQNCAASLTDGFPPLTFVPSNSGGCPPFGADFNGIFKQVTQWNQWQQMGGPVSYDAGFSTAIGGYPKGATLASATAGPGVTWTSTVDNNTSNPDTGGANWISGPLGTFISILSCGGDNTGTNANDAALSTCMTRIATTTGATLYFPAGTYKFNPATSVSLPTADALFSLGIAGDGCDATILYWPSGTGLTVNYTGVVSSSFNNQSTHWRDIAITTGASGGGNGLTLNQSVFAIGAQAPLTTLDRVCFHGNGSYNPTSYWSIGLNIVNVSNVNVTSAYFAGVAGSSPGIGLQFGGISSSQVAVVLNISGSTFNYLDIGFAMLDWAQGVTINQSNFIGNIVAIDVPSTAQLTTSSATTSASCSGNTCVLHFGVVPASVIPHLTVYDNSQQIALVAGTTVQSKTSNSVTITCGTGPCIPAGKTVNSADLIVFTGGFDAQLVISNSQFGLFNNNVNAVVTSVPMPDLAITNNTCVYSAITGSGCFIIAQQSNFTFTGNNMIAPAGQTSNVGLFVSNAPTPNVNGVSAATGAVTGNTASGFFGTGSIAMQFTASSQNIIASGNSFQNNTVDITNGNTNLLSNIIGSNVYSFGNSNINTFVNIVTKIAGGFGSAAGNLNGTSAAHGIALYSGASSGAGDNGSTAVLYFLAGTQNSPTTIGAITRAASSPGVVYWPNGTQPGINCPAGTMNNSTTTVMGGIVIAC